MPLWLLTTEVTPKSGRFFGNFEQEIASEFTVKPIARQSFFALWTESVSRFFRLHAENRCDYGSEWGFMLLGALQPVMHLRICRRLRPALAALQAFVHHQER